jgi:hypothetical protein
MDLPGNKVTAAESAAAPLPPGVTAMPEGVKTESTDETLRRIQDMASGGATGDAAADRAALDKQTLAAATTSKIKINLRHRNAPPDVKATASGDAFKGGSTERSNAPPAPAKPAAAPTKFKAGELEFG